jgi:hypothetical protein
MEQKKTLQLKEMLKMIKNPLKKLKSRKHHLRITEKKLLKNKRIRKMKKKQKELKIQKLLINQKKQKRLKKLLQVLVELVNINNMHVTKLKYHLLKKKLKHI